MFIYKFRFSYQHNQNFLTPVKELCGKWEISKKAAILS